MKALGVAVLVAVVALLGGTTTLRPATAAGEDDPDGLTLVELDPWVGADTTVTAVLRTGKMPAGATISPTLYDAVATRSAFELTTHGENLVAPIRHFDDLEVPATGGTTRLRFRVDDGSGTGDAAATDEPVTLTMPGTYPLVFTVLDADGVQTDRLVAYLVRLPTRPDEGDDGRHPLTVATQLRLQPRPTADADGHLTLTPEHEAAAEAFVTGVVGDERLDAPARRHLGYTISPALLDAAAGAGEPGLLADLAGATAEHQVQRQPWAPVSPGAWLTAPELTAELERSVEQGTTTLADHLAEPDPTLVDLPGWGPDVPPSALAWFADDGATAFLIAENDLEPLDPTVFPRTLAAPFLLETPTGPVPAAQIDSALSAHFDDPDPVLGANHLIADLAVIASDLPAIRRGVVVAPPPDWTPSAEFIGTYLDALDADPPPGSATVVVPGTAREIVTEVPDARAAGDTSVDGPVLTRRSSVGPLDTPVGLAGQVGRAGETVDSLAGMQPGGATEAETTIRWLRDRIALAAMPDVDATDRRRSFDAVTGFATAAAADIELSERQTITTTSSDASLPITIRRDADGPRRVSVHIDAPDRLEFPDGRTRNVDLDDTVTRLDLRVHADSPGDTLVRLTVTSPDGRLVSGTTELLVRSTAASGVGLVISFGSLAFLIIWWGRDILRARRRRRERHVPPADLIDIDG